MITILNRRMIVPENERIIGCYGDNCTVSRQFFIADGCDSNWDFKLYLEFSDGSINFFSLEKQIGNTGTMLIWNIERKHIAKSGIVSAQIKAMSGLNEVWYSNKAAFEVLDSIGYDSNFTIPTEYENFEKRVSNLYQAILEVDVNIPKIGENGNWWVYNAETNEYEDTGVKAEGEPGPVGPAGPQGEKGDNGADGKDGESGQMPVIAVTDSAEAYTLEPGKEYRFGERDVLDISFAEPTDTSIVNEYVFAFTCGDTPTQLVLPADIIWSSTPDIKANRAYRVEIANGMYGSIKEYPGSGNSSGTAEWKLLRSITVPEDASTDTSGVNWLKCASGGYYWGFDTDSTGKPFSVDELMIRYNASTSKSTSISSLDMQFRSGSPSYGYGQFSAPASFGQTGSKRYGWLKVESVADLWLGTGAWNNGGSSMNLQANRDYTSKAVTKITKMGIFFNNNADYGFEAGSTFKVYGR